MSIYIIRHGRTIWNAEGKIQGSLNSPLLPESIETSRKIGELLVCSGIKNIFCSPLQRCLETANTISEILECSYTNDARISECNHGLCEGLTHAEAREKYGAELSLRDTDKWNIPYPEGESYADVFARAKSFADDMKTNEGVLIIAHEMFNKCLIGYIIKWSPEEIIKFKQPNSIVAKIDFENRSLELVDSALYRNPLHGFKACPLRSR
ncbi:MAG: histidine phosphatase family protein [Treponema sp.]|nr:histidine phosphatase family protein [Treponema sp.]